MLYGQRPRIRSMFAAYLTSAQTRLKEDYESTVDQYHSCAKAMILRCNVATLTGLAFLDQPDALDIKGRFCPDRPALARLKGLGRTKTHDKTFAVLGGFWHDVA